MGAWREILVSSVSAIWTFTRPSLMSTIETIYRLAAAHQQATLRTGWIPWKTQNGREGQAGLTRNLDFESEQLPQSHDYRPPEEICLPGINGKPPVNVVRHTDRNCGLPSGSRPTRSPLLRRPVQSDFPGPKQPELLAT